MRQSSDVASPSTILILHHGASRVRGSERVLLGLLDGLEPDRFRFIVACQGDALVPAMRERGIAVEEVDFAEIVVSNTETRAPLRRYVKAFVRLRRLIRANDVRLVLANGGAPCQLGVPVAAVTRRPLMCLMHHPAQRKFQVFWLTRFVRTMVYVSEHTASHTRRLIGDGGTVVHPGVDVVRMVPVAKRDPEVRQSLGIPAAAVVFAQVGALVPYKGHRLLLEAFAAIAALVPAAHVVLIGDGPESAGLRALAAEFGVADRVTLTGFVPDVLPYLQHVIDVNVLPSSEEGLGLVTLEAGACAVPTVGADATGIRETIRNGETGMLVEPGSAPAIAAAMRELATDAPRRRALGAAARAHVVAHFSMARFSAQVGDVMTRAMQGCR